MSDILTFIILQKTSYYHNNCVLFYTFAYTNNTLWKRNMVVSIHGK